VTGGSFLAESSEVGRQCNPSALSLEGTLVKLTTFGREVLVQFPFVFLILAGLGLAYLVFSDRAAAILLGVVFLGSLAHGLAYRWLGIEDFQAFLIPGLLVLALCAAVGLDLLLRFVENLHARPGNVPLALLSVLALALPLLRRLGRLPGAGSERDPRRSPGGRGRGPQREEGGNRPAPPEPPLVHGPR
jgi:hypothetical protein